MEHLVQIGDTIRTEDGVWIYQKHSPETNDTAGVYVASYDFDKEWDEQPLPNYTDPNGLDPKQRGCKLDAEKPKWYLLPWKIIEGIVKVMTFGAAKYSENGWQSVPQAKERYFAAMMRHKMEMDDGMYFDPESGLPHWAHFCCNAIFLGFFYNQEPRENAVKIYSDTCPPPEI